MSAPVQVTRISETDAVSATNIWAVRKECDNDGTAVMEHWRRPVCRQRHLVLSVWAVGVAGNGAPAAYPLV